MIFASFTNKTLIFLLIFNLIKQLIGHQKSKRRNVLFIVADDLGKNNNFIE